MSFRDAQPIGLLADIHANVWALEAVLEHGKKRGVASFLNLGDVLYGPLQSRATYERLLREKILLTIQGNQDRQIYDATAEDLAANPTLAFVMRDLGDEPIHWLRQLPATAVFQDEIFLCHGTPASDTAYLLENVSSGAPQVGSEAAIREQLKNVAQTLVVCGHTHIPRVVQLSNGPLILNPGSIGVAAYDDVRPTKHRMENFSPHASYAILEKSKFGWNISLERVAYDHESAAGRARSLGREDWATAIATGRTSG